MSVPAILHLFPVSTSPALAAAVRQLARQWRIFFRVGNLVFRPISSLGALGYAYAAWVAYVVDTKGRVRGNLREMKMGSSGEWWKGMGKGKGMGSGVWGRVWMLYVLAAACHVVNVVHSKMNMQGLNERIMEFEGLRVGALELEFAEGYVRRWARLNKVRMVMPLVAGSAALWARLGGCQGW